MNRRELLTSLAVALGPVPWLTVPTVARTQGAQIGGTTPPVNVLEFEPLARQRLSRPVWDYISQGAADEITLRRNREAFDALRLRTRVLTDVSSLDTRLELFGQKLDFPIMLAPRAKDWPAGATSIRRPRRSTRCRLSPRPPRGA